MSQVRKFAGLTYEEAVRRYADMVTRVCIIRCGNPDDAKDCFQNVFLKLYLSEVEYQSMEHLKAWLLKVAIRQCQDMVKQYWKKNIHLSGDNSEFDLRQVNITEEKDTQVIESVLSLPMKYRQVIYLYYYEEYDLTEIADILSLKEATVKSQLRRGRIALKKMLGGLINEKAI